MNLINWFLALIPLLIVLVLMLRFQWSGAKAGAVGWSVALVIAVLRFGTGWRVLAYAQLKGALLTLFVLYIIWAALLFYRVTDEAGAVRAIGAGLPRLTPDRGMQALLLGWVFSSFLQGVSGFGVPVAIVAPLMAGLGFPTTSAVTIPSVGHPWAITFGSLGASFFALIAATGRAGATLAPWSAIMLTLACFCCGTATLWAAGGWPTLRNGLIPLLLIGTAMSGAQYLTVTNGMWSIGGMMGGLAGLAVGVTWARLKRGPMEPQESTSPASKSLEGEMALGWALVPYGILIIIVLTAQLVPQIHDFLGQVVLRVQFPELSTTKGWVTPAETGRTINLFGHAGALLSYASLLTYVLFHLRGNYGPGVARRIASGVVRRATRSSLGTAAMVGMAVTMQHAGMTYLLAKGLAQVAGPIFPLVAPFIGALGAFMTGSNTNSNVVLGDLQQSVAALTGLNPLIILAAQTAGAAIGSATAPAKVIVGCSTVKAEEGPALKAVLRYAVVILLVLSAATGAAIYL